MLQRFTYVLELIYHLMSSLLPAAAAYMDSEILQLITEETRKDSGNWERVLLLPVIFATGTVDMHLHGNYSLLKCK